MSKKRTRKQVRPEVERTANENEGLVSSSLANRKLDTVSNMVGKLREKPLIHKPSQNFIQRTVWTVIMLVFFFIILAMGPFWILVLVTVLQIGVYKEVIAIASVPSREKDLPLTKVVNWCFLITTLYYAYGESILRYFHHLLIVDSYLMPLATHHRFISFMLYTISFVLFVASLKKGNYKFQFSQFCWTHMTLLLVVGQAHFMINNIFEGLFWFFVPVCYVVCNDVFAYLCGKVFGKHPLIQLSPKKTVEGFVGGWVCTVVVGSLLSFMLMRSNYFICPTRDLSATIFSNIECVPNSVFLPKTYNVPLIMSRLFRFPRTLTLAPIYFHLAVFATFASLVAPFGGFFASGLKRAFKLKDFGDSIPGHGGLTDRVDCQLLNGAFVYMYVQSFISEKRGNVTELLEIAVTSLTSAEQLELFEDLKEYLISQGKLTVDAICQACR
ncbi:phosphatidate cytidylyltransferase [Schizosaccharomyces japonicus yFS275]|uniref:Phosphatidate cytidylyltransferase n=1 Tax=Schizosaccharomyces japonicus (strain yFS275 / FY16936) TaxID=402676 RepID=B6JVL2_SCHJY|nr:phosphatidate cytidylyltransferase [Schizosaccharomyces japonicus yFS275]EEB05413.2 phosphatidate cytidylyltransferase [Schizosaccharomyces japonicus yFS275]